MADTQRRTRKQARISCALPVVINGFTECLAFDISEGGLYVNCTEGMKQGGVVIISITQSGEKIAVKARVKHIQEGVGTGLMFIDLEQSLKNKLQKMVASLQQPGPR